MANTKISALAAAASLADADVLAGVQSATNKKFALSDLKAYCRTRKDASVNSAVDQNGGRNCAQSSHIVWTAAGTYYVFFAHTDNADFYWTKTTDYGVTWKVPTAIKATTSAAGLAVWADWWTPGDSGTRIRIAMLDFTDHRITYNALDVSDDTLDGELTVSDITSVVQGQSTCLSITKAVAGLIHVAYDGDGGTERGHYKSDASTPTSFASADGSGELVEATSDYFMLFPGDEAAPEDIWCMYWDRSADAITLKTYDDSGSAWTESDPITSMTDLAAGTANPQFAGTVLANGSLGFVAWSNADTATATLRFWTVTGAASLPGTPVTIVTSSDDQAMCAISRDTDNDDLYVYYAGKTDGTETSYTALNIYYKKSTDDGATWGAETLLSNIARPVSYLTTSLAIEAADFTALWGGVEVSNAINYRVSALA